MRFLARPDRSFRPAGRALWVAALWAATTCGAHRSAETASLRMDGRDATVDLYWPATREPAPLVVVAHGFGRSRHRMVGWGEALAARGYVAAVPTLPYLAAHTDNASGVVDLIAGLRASHPDRIDPAQLVLVGFSAGGLVTARAATEVAGLRLWVGLDPVDSGGVAVAAAQALEVPGVVLFAEPHGCNAEGNGEAIADAWRGPRFSARISGGTHCDPEWPSNASCALFCGGADPGRADAFADLALDAIDAALACDPAALSRLELAGSDARISDRVDRGLVAAIRDGCAGSPTEGGGAR